MTTLMLIRHGETEWNKEEIYRGWAEVELNENGMTQAKLLADYLADIRITAIYSSPLKRALKTTEIIASRHAVNVETAPELKDLNYGEWQGLSHDQVKEKYQALLTEWQKSPQQVTLPGGESLGEVRERTMKLLEKGITEGKKIVALVTHRVPIKVLICALLGLDNSHFWNIKIDNCGITIFVQEHGRFVLDRHNDTCFLRSLGKAALKDF